MSSDDGETSRAPDGGGGDAPSRESPGSNSTRSARKGGAPGHASETRGFVAGLREFRTADGAVGAVREMLSSAALVLLAGAVLFAASGVWPPMVAVKSNSMQPHMAQGDLVFIVEESRLSPEAAVDGTGVVTHEVATETGYEKFGGHGDVVVYRPDGRSVGDPIIHRAMFYVKDGENWYSRANPSYIQADSCAELDNCPAPHAGFITKGDNPTTNQYYDQTRGMSGPVKPSWIEGKAMVRIPGLGWIRLKWSQLQRGAVTTGAGTVPLVGPAGGLAS